MNTTNLEHSKRIIGERVELFARNINQYHHPDYKEAQLRQEFLNPFFEALGWDVNNRQGWAEQYKEVVNEDALKARGTTQAPDYSFRIGGVRKFFVEAKKPARIIKTDASAAYQLRRYAWSAKLPLSLLSDFEELAVYDCRIRPFEADKASVGRIDFITFDHYLDQLPELYDTFSKEAVLRGSFDRFVQEAKGKRGTAPVDTEFLKEIERWRAILAKDIAQQNPRLSIDELNDAVQRTIDRIIFLRMAEDRGVEEYGRLAGLAKRPNVYQGLLTFYNDADAKYNSGLFDFSADMLTPHLRIDAEKLSGILEDLYYPRAPYEFSVLAPDTLGKVYEQFLGSVIRLTPAHLAKIEEKPEVRHAGGVHYTPMYIGQYLATETVGKLIAGKSPQEIARIRVLDIACGSGTLLLCAFELLLEHYLNWYTTHRDEKRVQNRIYESATGWRLTTAEKKRILTTHIFGVDIDRQAVEVTKLSLLLKVLEGESQETLGKQLALFKERALPNLDDNIKCGNSLIGTDYFAGQLMPDEHELRRVNPFDWAREFPEIMRDGGFDCIIGNPPYIRIQTMKEWAPLEVEIYKEEYSAASSGNYDIYVVFVEKGLSLLNKHGRLGFILPSKFFATDYGQSLRQQISERKALAGVVDFGHAQVFENATTYTCLLFLTKEPSQSISYVKIASPPDLAKEPISGQILKSELFTARPWIFANDLETALSNKIATNSVPLGELPSRIGRGSSSGADDVFILHRNGRVLTTRQGERVEIEPTILRIPIYATDFGRYRFNPQSEEVIIFPYNVGQDGYELKTESEMERKFPKAYKYLASRKKTLCTRKQFKEWYGFSAPRNLNVHDEAQMLVPLLADRGLYCRLPERTNHFCLMASGGFSITVDSNTRMSPEYVLGLLNSRILFWRLRSISNLFRGGWITCTKQYVETLPIHIIKPGDASEQAHHDRIVSLVTQILDVHKRLAATTTAHDRELLQRQIDATDEQIDAVVFELYGLNNEEIKTVSG